MDGFPSIPETGSNPSLVRPVWADPGYFLALYNVRVSEPDITAGGPLPVAPADPNRWAIGFALPTAIVGNVTVAPWGDPETFTFCTLSGSLVQWFKLFDFGPLVSFEWFCNSDPGSRIRVIEIYNRM